MVLNWREVHCMPSIDFSALMRYTVISGCQLSEDTVPITAKSTSRRLILKATTPVMSGRGGYPIVKKGCLFRRLFFAACKGQ